MQTASCGIFDILILKMLCPLPRDALQPPHRQAVLRPAAPEFHLNFNAEPFSYLFVSLTSVNPYP